MSTFVSVGTAYRPFTRLLDAITEVVSVLPQPVIVQSGHTPFHTNTCTIIPFMAMDEYEAAVANARLVVMQAGGGGVICAIRSRQIPIVMARRAAEGEAIDDHQIVWARALGHIGKAIVIEEAHELRAAVEKAVSRSRVVSASEVRMVQSIRELLGQIDRRRRGIV